MKLIATSLLAFTLTTIHAQGLQIGYRASISHFNRQTKGYDNFFNPTAPDNVFDNALVLREEANCWAFEANIDMFSFKTDKTETFDGFESFTERRQTRSKNYTLTFAVEHALYTNKTLSIYLGLSNAINVQRDKADVTYIDPPSLNEQVTSHQYNIMLGIRQYSSLHLTNKLLLTNLLQLSADPSSYINSFNSRDRSYRIQWQIGLNYCL